jgi:hypothetical protein
MRSRDILRARDLLRIHGVGSLSACTVYRPSGIPIVDRKHFLLESRFGGRQGSFHGIPGALDTAPEIVPGPVAGIAQLLGFAANRLAPGLDLVQLLSVLNLTVGSGRFHFGFQFVDFGIPLIDFGV